MKRMLFINLPVTDLEATRTFYTGLGFATNEEFCDDESACIVISDTIFVMALPRARFADFVRPRRRPDDQHPGDQLPVRRSRVEVDDLVARALAYGGQPWREPMANGPMYGHSFTDPDGHVWEVMYMEMSG